MNEQVQKQLLEWAGTTAEKGATFLEQELPLFAGEIVAWYFWSSLFLVALFAMLSCLAWCVSFLAFKCLAPTAKTDDDKAFCAGAVIVFFLIGVISCAWGCGYHGYNATKAAVAPRVVLLEQVIQLKK